MYGLPFDEPGQFWRGNLHTHSTLSDGGMDPEVVCARYAEAGYDFISLTEHFLPQYQYPIADTRGFRTDDFTTIIGAELHAGETEFGGMWHILAVGLPLDFARPDEDETGPQIAQRAMDVGAFVGIAHPQWYTLTERDIESLDRVDAIEVYNGVAIDHNDRADSWQITDIMLGRGRRYLAYAADDFHFMRNRADFMRGWVWVKSEHLTPESILAALKKGHFYSSTGPLIHDIQVEPGKEVVVRCSPAAYVCVSGAGPAAAAQEGNGLIEARLDMRRWSGPYCRVTVRDAQGGRAWSNPIWFESGQSD